MKGCFLLLFCLLTTSTVFAATPAPTAAAAASTVSHAEAQAESKQIKSANAPNTAAPAPAGTLGAGSGYVEVVGGFGVGHMTVGKSLIGVTNTEFDWLSQTGKRWQSPFAHFGIGYVYALSDTKRGYAEKLTWFPTVEAMLNVNYFNLNASGNVYRFNNPLLTTQTFILPIKTTSLMLDAILTLATFKQVSVFVLGGVGEAWSDIKYSDTPNANPSARPSLSLSSRTQSNMAYEWGTGISLAFNPRLALSLKYLYTHIGNINTSGQGTLGGVTDTQINAAGFSLRAQAAMLDLHVALY